MEQAYIVNHRILPSLFREVSVLREDCIFISFKDINTLIHFNLIVTFFCTKLGRKPITKDLVSVDIIYRRMPLNKLGPIIHAHP